jgi:hypothetical protein
VVLRGPRPTSAPTGEGPRRPSAVQVLAPAAAAPVLAVDARAVGPCAPGTRCRLRVVVQTRPQSQARRVRWTLALVDRCSGAVTNRPGGALTVAAGAGFGQGQSQVVLPRRTAIAVVALTDEPTRAASRPVDVVPLPTTCPAR